MILKEEERNIITGILGTIGIHLLVLIIFLIARLEKVHVKYDEPITIEFDEQLYKTLEQMVEEEKPVESQTQALTQEDIKNIAVNTANQLENQISTEKYIEDLKQELNIKDLNQQLDRSLENDLILNENQPEKIDKSEEKSQYQGPTRISYYLENRTDRYIYRPIYKCYGGGKVVVDIVVNQSGEVINAVVQSSTTSEECVTETAIESAYKSIFNIDQSADPKQRGTITYEFVAQ